MAGLLHEDWAGRVVACPTPGFARPPAPDRDHILYLARPLRLVELLPVRR